MEQMKWNAGFLLVLYLVKLNQVGIPPKQWYECVKHATILDRSSVELTV